MRCIPRLLIIMCLFIITPACTEEEPLSTYKPTSSLQYSPSPSSQYPKIASWLSKKDQIIESQKPFNLVTAAFFMPDEASRIKQNNPDGLLMAGLTTNWIWDNEEWKKTLTTFASYGTDKTYEITKDMYLIKLNGEKCSFGWASENWGHEEIFAMDPRNPQWVELVTAYYETVLEQPQHDGIIIDMVTETSFCREAISDADWIAATQEIFAKLSEINPNNKLVMVNSGRNYSEIDAYAEFIDGYFMENFMGNYHKSTYEEGLRAADADLTVVYAMDTDNTGIKDMNKMRLGLTLSLLNDNTYFAYDFGPRDHGQAWWFPEYDVSLGNPIHEYYRKDDAYWREFENGTVVSSPYSTVEITFDNARTDITTGEQSLRFTVYQGDGRIFLTSQ